MKQFKIDKGQLGGFIIIFMNSLVVMSPISFMGILALNYDKYITTWLTFYQFLIISTILMIIYEWAFFAFVYPSMMQFSNRQVCEHENPVIKRIDILEEKLDKLTKLVENK